MGIKISIQLPPSLTGGGKLGKIESLKNALLLRGGVAIQKLLKDHMRMLEQTRGKYPSGKRSKHFKPEDVLSPVVNGESVSVGITTPGITRALHDIIIRPVEAKMLAIPLHADAYGMQPREYNIVHPKGTKEQIFLIKAKSGNLFLAKNNGKDLVLMYILKDRVYQRQDPTLLPTKEQMQSTFTEAVDEAVKTILKAMN